MLPNYSRHRIFVARLTKPFYRCLVLSRWNEFFDGAPEEVDNMEEKKKTTEPVSWKLGWNIVVGFVRGERRFLGLLVKPNDINNKNIGVMNVKTAGRDSVSLHIFIFNEQFGIND